jgi:hypothetical protein
MSEQSPTIIVVCGARDAVADAARTRLGADGAAARWVPLRDRDHLDEFVAAGARRLIFRRREDLLEALWHNEVDVPAWLALDVRIEFLSDADGAADRDARWLADIAASWAAHRRRERRAQMIAAVILSIVALTAAFLALR